MGDIIQLLQSFVHRPLQRRQDYPMYLIREEPNQHETTNSRGRYDLRRRSQLGLADGGVRMQDVLFLSLTPILRPQRL